MKNYLNFNTFSKKPIKFNPAELQVGDWVQSWYEFPMRITCIGEDYACAAFEDSKGDALKFNDEDAIIGITLTTDILRLNGWRNDVESNHWWRKGVEFVIFHDLQSLKNFYCCGISSISLDTVDKLQRLLRLSGRKDLADNFRV